MIQDRLDSYNQDHCWQYDIRLNNFDDDLKTCGLTKDYIQKKEVLN
jgi:hypothetical protein